MRRAHGLLSRLPLQESRKQGGPHAALDRSISALNALRFLFLRDSAAKGNLTVRQRFEQRADSRV